VALLNVLAGVVIAAVAQPSNLPTAILYLTLGNVALQLAAYLLLKLYLSWGEKGRESRECYQGMFTVAYGILTAGFMIAAVMYFVTKLVRENA